MMIARSIVVFGLLWTITTAAAADTVGSVDYSVGIIPATSGRCPAGSSNLQIYMDEEDSPPCCTGSGDLHSHWNPNSNTSDPYGTWKTGWVGAIDAEWRSANPAGKGRGFKYEFCRVNGMMFRPMTFTGPDAATRYYAVLKLGDACPAGSTEFSRYFDNEDQRNENNAWGNIWPYQKTHNWDLHYCLFRAGETSAPSSIMNEFPNLGVPYGVFARADHPSAVASGYVHSNEEASGAQAFNTFTAPPDAYMDARRIIQPFSDSWDTVTYHHTAEVSVATCAPGSATNAGQPCGCGYVQCDGTCNVPTPFGFGSPCGLCGGTIACDGHCSVATPLDYGQPCGSCGGVIGCGGCTVATPPSLGMECNNCGGAVQCDGTCSRPMSWPCSFTCWCADFLIDMGHTDCSDPNVCLPPDPGYCAYYCSQGGGG